MTGDRMKNGTGVDLVITLKPQSQGKSVGEWSKYEVDYREKARESLHDP